MKSPINALAAVLAICFLVPQLAAPVPARAAELDPLKTREKPKIVQPKILSSERPRETPSLPGHPDVRREILPNGLTLITKVDRSAPVVSAQAWVKTGSILESSHMGAGLSHILEHMLFKGTAKRQGAQIAKEVEENGGYINAYTSWDRTVFHIDIPKDGGAPNTDRGTEESIDILLDAVMNATLPPDEYKLEQTVILREMAMNRDNPDRQASELLFSTAYATHPYRFPVIGYEDIYLQLNREEVFAYYKERYVPNNVIFIVAGDIDPDKVRSQVVELTKTWARKSIGPIYIPDEPLQVAPREVVEEMPQELSRIHLAYQTVDFRNPDSYALDILAIIAGQGNSSRLFQNLREKKDIVHEIDAWSHTPAFRGLFGVSATADPDKVEAARAAILRELDQFKTELVTRNELQKAIKQSLSSHLAAKKTMSGQASDLGSGELLAGDVFYGDHYLEEIKKVTPEDIRRVAKTYFVPSALTSVVLNPKGTTKRSQEAAAKQESRDIQKYVLKNGLTLLVKADNRLPFVDFRLVMKSGLLFENEKNNGISSLLAKALLKGTKRRSAEQIVSSLESVGGSITSFSGNNSLGVSIEV
ncbi:MAG: insulinase family protein, partial [Verrucomicrobiae bacterium]|nr:insulinase family protein [Verrucomicrobiae bacterium]